MELLAGEATSRKKVGGLLRRRDMRSDPGAISFAYSVATTLSNETRILKPISTERM